MKMTLIACFLGFFATTAGAVTLTPLATPANVPHGYPYTTQCIATAFTANDSSTGLCDASVGGAGSGRGGRGPRTNYVYTATWDVDGNALGATYCGKAVGYGAPYPFTWTYGPGFNPTNCSFPSSGQDQVSLYDPALGYDAWFFYQSASSDGAYELVSLGLYGYIYGL